MIIAIYGRSLAKEAVPELKELFSSLARFDAGVMIFTPFKKFLVDTLHFDLPTCAEFDSAAQVKMHADLMLSLGGDGTFLESVAYVEESCIPVVGINFGRLGFLAHIASGNIGEAIEQLFTNQYRVEARSMLSVTMPNNPFNPFPFGLNDFSLQKNGSSMITVNAYINNEFLCTYWADGLIVSTPTGSTAYSLSVGGPIVSPNTSAMLISPIAPHHLTVRPLLIPDNSVLRLEASGRDESVTVSLDSHSYTIPAPVSIEVAIAPFKVGVVILDGTSYYKTLRGKLMWGADSRN
ncbi:MAG: NAD kinase [Tenuifilaceae bacterium]|jgi:NAD+ kinase|nr:NAD kinase [Tenuifilaceae bacterium]